MTTTRMDPAGPTGPRPPRDAGGYSVIDAIDAGTAVRDLYARRSRRVTLGTKTDGPLGHAPRVPDRIGGRTIPAPITKEEEAYLVAAAVGITGPLRADLPYSRDGGGRTMMSFYGRTIASPDAAHNQRLIVLNDAGSWLIRSPQDFPPDALPERVELVQRKRWNDWYDRMRVRLSTRRAGIPRRLPYQVPFKLGHDEPARHDLLPSDRRRLRLLKHELAAGLEIVRDPRRRPRPAPALDPRKHSCGDRTCHGLDGPVARRADSRPGRTRGVGHFDSAGSHTAHLRRSPKAPIRL